jgi:hypothetical protein
MPIVTKGGVVDEYYVEESVIDFWLHSNISLRALALISVYANYLLSYSMEQSPS